MNKTSHEVYLEALKKEYDIEVNQKQSLETRAGLIMAFIAVIALFILESISIKGSIAMIISMPTTVIVIKGILGLVTNTLLIIALIKLFQTIKIVNYSGFQISAMDSKLLQEECSKGIVNMTDTYKEIVLSYRDNNKQKAEFLMNVINFTIATVAFAFVYLNI